MKTWQRWNLISFIVFPVSGPSNYRRGKRKAVIESSSDDESDDEEIKRCSEKTAKTSTEDEDGEWKTATAFYTAKYIKSNNQNKLISDFESFSLFQYFLQKVHLWQEEEKSHLGYIVLVSLILERQCVPK